MNILYSQDANGCHQDSIAAHTVTIIKDILTADLPQELDDMPEHLKDSFYPYEDRPPVIMSDPEGRVQMTFQILQKELRDAETRKAAQAVHRYTEYFYSRNELSPVYINRSGEVPVGWFLMEMELGDLKCHHIKAVRTVLGKLCLMTVTYPEEECIKWQAVLKRLYLTLQERNGKDGESQQPGYGLDASGDAANVWQRRE